MVFLIMDVIWVCCMMLRSGWICFLNLVVIFLFRLIILWLNVLVGWWFIVILIFLVLLMDWILFYSIRGKMKIVMWKSKMVMVLVYLWVMILVVVILLLVVFIFFLIVSGSKICSVVVWVIKLKSGLWV